MNELHQDEIEQIKEFLSLPDFKRKAGSLNDNLLQPVLTGIFAAAAYCLISFFVSMIFPELGFLGSTCAALIATIAVALLLNYSGTLNRLSATLTAILLFIEARIFASRRALNGRDFFERVKAEYPATFHFSYWHHRPLNKRAKIS